ncbi:serine protease [Pseudomonas sp. PDM27]|uniref:S1 family peptidase n=1 Tax=Pseudomonas sp. PDM27 TaxID=2854769 RepID=UPI001C48024B|nr:serine protease [Pseudomonas sp. PDM27]MBV7569641.1 serine protease [Pseudomonas sp. PDM27]
MLKAGFFTILLTSALPAVGLPYDDSGASVIQLHVFGTLKKPLPDTDTIDFHSRGTGFLVSPDGLVLSAGHLIPAESLFDDLGFHIEGYFPVRDDDSFAAVDPPVTLKVIKAKTEPYDVALLRIIDYKILKPFLSLCDAYKKGEKIDFAILGYQGGDRLLTSNWGPIMAGAGAATNIVLQIPLNGGNSGGPLFNEQGKVFGIAIGERTAAGQRMNATALAVPMAKAMATLGDEASGIKGVSYNPDCNINLLPQTVVNISQNLPIVEMTLPPPPPCQEFKWTPLFLTSNL